MAFTENELIYLPDMEIRELEELLAGMGCQRYRGRQIFRWIASGARDFDEMTDLSLQLRKKLKLSTEISGLKIRRRLVSQKDETSKYVFELNDGNIIEGVLMKYKHGYTVCISSQVGCRMGCRFCASTIGGLIRNLSPGEMLEQVTLIQRDSGKKISNIVVMGIGEPFDNYDNLLKFLRLAHEPSGMNIGYRHMTVSTCGIVPGILKFSRENLQVNLAVSLHAPNDSIRRQLMPVGRKYSIDKIIGACKIYTEMTGRRVTFEYALIAGVNDSAEHADMLAFRLKEMLSHVNLIPVNTIDSGGYHKSSDERIRTFEKRLLKGGVETTLRRNLGSDIKAACGQLRKSEIAKNRNNEKGAEYLKYAARTDIGSVREKNEDSFAVIGGNPGLPHIFVIADGMGGHNYGDIASKTAVKFIKDYFSDNIPSSLVSGGSDDEVRDIVNGSNAAVYQKSLELPDAGGMGTTLTMAIVNDNDMTVAHIGDSRLYQVRNDSMYQITEDHSYTGELMKKGTLTKEEAEKHPRRHVITRALGCFPETESDIIKVPMKKGDTYLLCTDGLTDMLSEEEIADILRNRDPDLACEQLISGAKERGGGDNITAIVIKYE